MPRFSRFFMMNLFATLAIAVSCVAAPAPAPGAGAASPAGAPAAAVPAGPAPANGSWNSLFGLGDAIMGAGANVEVQAYDSQDYATSALYLEVFHRLNPGDPAISKRLGFAYKEIGRYEEAHDLLFQATVDAPDDYVVWWWLSDAQRLLGEYEKAYDSMLTARDVAPENQRAELQTYVDYTESLATKVPAWSVFEKHRDFARRHEANRRVRRVIAEYLNALESVPPPQGTREDEGPVRRAWVNNQIGIQYNQLKQPEQALAYFWRSLRIFEAQKSDADVMMIYQNLGVTYRAMAEKSPEHRTEYFELAQKYWAETSRLAAIVNDVAYIRYAGAGQLLCAVEAFGVEDPRVVALRATNRKELPWQGPINEFTTGTVALAELACRMAEKDYAGARVVGEMAGEFYSKSGFLLDNEEGMNVYLKLSRVFAEQGHFEEAVAQADLADDVLTRLRSFMDADAFARSTNPIALAGIATARARAAVLKGDFDAAMHAVETYRLQARADIVGGRVLEQAYLNDYATEKDLLTRGLVLLEQDLAGLGANADPAEATRLKDRIAADTARLAWLSKGIRFAAAEAVSYRSVPRLGAMERATAFPADTQWVSVVSDAYGSVVLVSDAKSAWGLVLPDLDGDALRGLADAAVAALASGADAVPALDALSAQLIAPIREHLTAKTLYFGVDAALGNVPCELLRDQGKYLIATHDVGYAPCTSYLIHTDESPAVDSTALRLVTADAAALQAIFPQGGACATELCAAHAADAAGVVVIDAPVDVAAVDPMLASLTLGAEGIYDGALYAAELLGARVNSNALWLIPGEAKEPWQFARLVGFDEGFLQAGVRQVVRPLLPVDAAVQARLLATAAGGAISLESLSAAKRAALAENPAQLSPAFVAYFGAAR